MLLIDSQINDLYDAIKKYKTIIIHRHVRPDPDAIGSQLGLKQLIQHQFPDKKVLAAGTTAAGLRWLGEMDKVISADYHKALVIVCDTANQERIDGAGYDQGAYLIKIDHHPITDSYGDLEIVHPEATSTCQLITELSSRLIDKLPMTDEAASLLYAGIVSDTGRFKFSPTVDTFQAAGYLMNYQVPTRTITDQFEEMSLALARFKGHVLETMTVTDEGIAYLVISQADIAKYGITEEETNAVVNLPNTIKGVYAWVNFIEQKNTDYQYRVRLRSKGPIINQLAELHHGGGHAMASGAKAYDDKEKDTIIQSLAEITQNFLAKR